MNRLVRRRLLKIKHYLVKTKPFHFVTESYSRDRGKQNGDIVTIFSLITIILVFKSRKEVLKPLLSRGCFHRLAGFYKSVSVILL